MVRMIKASEEQGFNITVCFAGYIGVENEYYVKAADRDEAEELALDEAFEDLEVDEIEDLGDGDYEVTIVFNGFSSGPETYEVYADDEDEAAELALEEARGDLEATFVEEDEEE